MLREDESIYSAFYSLYLHLIGPNYRMYACPTRIIEGRYTLAFALLEKRQDVVPDAYANKDWHLLRLSCKRNFHDVKEAKLIVAGMPGVIGAHERTPQDRLYEELFNTTRDPGRWAITAFLDVSDRQALLRDFRVRYRAFPEEELR